MFSDFLNKYSLHGNWVDLAFIILIIYFVATQKGFINTFLETIVFVLSLIMSFKFYSLIGNLLILNFSLPHGIANALGFVLVWFFAELIFSVFLLSLLQHFLLRFAKVPINFYLGFVAAIIQASFLFLFFVSFIFAFPVRGQIKQAVLDSKSGPYFINLSSNLEIGLKSIFGQAINETLNFLTIKNETGEKIDLGFKTSESQLTNDSQSEDIMINLLNQERSSRGIKTLAVDEKLREVARLYGKEMFTNGFFSHVSVVNGSTPADRALKYGITFSVIGENLAFAPDVYIAHQGLMNSEGHRKNILSTDYGKVGIGVVDGGIYGKMFVQEFTN